MNTVTRAAVYTARIATATAATPVRVGAAASSATAELVGWELRQLASSPLSAEARRLRAEYRELAAAGGGGADKPAAAPRTGTPARSDKPRAQLAAMNSSR
jgi:hypothetical protein